jgi:hypothetical protein
MRTLLRLLPTVLALLVIAAVAYAFTDSFGQRWIGKVEEQLRARGVHAEVKRLGLSVVNGVVARDITVFQDAAHTRLLMTMDQLNLDLDYEKLLHREFPIEALDLSDANVSMPLGGKDSPTLELRNLSALIFVSDQRLEITRAQGDVAGRQFHPAKCGCERGQRSHCEEQEARGDGTACGSWRSLAAWLAMVAPIQAS